MWTASRPFCIRSGTSNDRLFLMNWAQRFPLCCELSVPPGTTEWPFVILYAVPIAINLIWGTLYLRKSHFWGVLSIFCSGQFSWIKILIRLAGADFFLRYFLPKILSSGFRPMWQLYDEKSTIYMAPILIKMAPIHYMVTHINCMKANQTLHLHALCVQIVQ